MPASEIDDIFASKPTTPSLQRTKKKKDKKRKRLTADPDPVSTAPTASASAVVPETVVDPSVAASRAPSQPEKRKRSKAEVPSPAKKVKHSEDEARFKDSRGTGPRRKTEEGFSIFKEDELDIRPEAGGTPLCPFDCDCCF
ncbi:DUF1764-domain-containing protein [Auriscalpium vulgare]|uniref:DUF1764-domain-containing protein n=1 Tax=Auriscalpium vulgare TaxID=40419 RepID=A0ACB8RWS2_9AGAM|nr:DUF1764-domain-containing protein [Auriscalpium vulgare]